MRSEQGLHGEGSCNFRLFMGLEKSINKCDTRGKAWPDAKHRAMGTIGRNKWDLIGGLCHGILMFVVSKKTQNNAVKSYSSIVCIVLVVEKNSKYNRDLWFHNIVRHLSGDQQTSKHAEESYMHPADSFVYLHECLINGTRTSCARHLTAFFFSGNFLVLFSHFLLFLLFHPSKNSCQGHWEIPEHFSVSSQRQQTPATTQVRASFSF